MNAAFKRRISNKFQAGSVPRFFCQCKPVAGIRGKGWSKRHTLLYQVTGDAEMRALIGRGHTAIATRHNDHRASARKIVTELSGLTSWRDRSEQAPGGDAHDI
jgi:hypothetical protein